MKIIKELSVYNNFSEILEDASRVYSDKIFLAEKGKECSFSEFNRLVNRCARLLLSDGIKSGDIVSVVFKNSMDFLVLYFAALRLGCRINPFPFHLGPKEIKSKLEFIKPRIVYIHERFGEELGGSGLNIKLAQADNKKMLETLIEGFQGDALKVSGVDPDQAEFLYYSSGTTGSPKIIEYSAKSEVVTMASLIRSSFIDKGWTHICMLPLGHTAAIRYSILPCLCTGSKVFLFESFWKIRTDIWKLVSEHKVSFFEVVPSILITILNTPYQDMEELDISSLRFIGCGSAYLPKNLQDSFEHKFRVPVANMYGLSETGPTHFDNPFEPGRKTGSVGRPLDIMDVKIFDDNGSEAGPGESGEFGVRGQSLLKGYYEDRYHYERCFNKDGYFLTGDLGYEDENGIFYYVDRKKDLIVKGGVNIVPSQIDEALLSHQAVEEAATVSKPDIFLGETIKSYVVLKKGHRIEHEELKAHCRNQLGDFKTPSEFEFVDELPKGPSGKILKRVLRDKELEKVKDK